MSSLPRLHTYFRSSCSYRVRIALNYKEIEYEQVAVNLLQGQQKSPKYKACNPTEMVPTLEIDGHKLIQSLAILEYLDERENAMGSTSTLLLPSDLRTRQVCREISHIIGCDTQPLQNSRVLQHVETAGISKKEWAQTYIGKGFGAVEKVLGHTRKEFSTVEKSGFCVGNQMSVADICIIGMCYNADRMEVDMTQFPLLSQVKQRMLSLDVVKAAHPHTQTDCPENLRENL